VWDPQEETDLFRLHNIFWVVTRRHIFLVYDQRFGFTRLSHLQGLELKDLKTLKMGQTSYHETLVIHQITTPGNNPQDVKQHYDNGGSLQSHRPISTFSVYYIQAR
jgi:hypothetical protein